MTIALDYDGTYTADPEFWDGFIYDAKARGHKIICVTCRGQSWDNTALNKLPILVYYTDCAPKRWYMEQKGIVVDVWIEDCPECVKDGR